MIIVNSSKVTRFTNLAKATDQGFSTVTPLNCMIIAI